VHITKKSMHNQNKVGTVQIHYLNRQIVGICHKQNTNCTLNWNKFSSEKLV
jgi:hypothetical protein